MPSSPKILEITGEIRESEIESQIESQHSRRPSGHIRIARKITINLEPASPPSPVGQGEFRRPLKHTKTIRAKLSAEHTFLNNPTSINVKPS